MPTSLAMAENQSNIYSGFRIKWDLYVHQDKDKNELIVDALRYYYTRHKPFRDFKVALKAFGKFFTEKSWHSLRWSITCLKNGLTDLVFHEKYRSNNAETGGFELVATHGKKLNQLMKRFYVLP